MSLPIIDTAFAAGELTPSLYGRVDIAKFHIGGSTVRNLFVSYRGGAYSRAGTAFVGYSRQTGRTVPPRLITFQFSILQGLALEFGNFYMRVVLDGNYVTETPLNISNISRADPMVVTVANNYAPGDWIFISGAAGMPQVNEQTYVVTTATPTQFTAQSVFQVPIDSTHFGIYTGGATAARIYTLVTPWAEADVRWLKFNQSADVMTICCWNQITGTSYVQQNLIRLADDNWTLSPPVFASTMAAPGGLNGASFGAGSTQLWAFSYQVTAVNALTGDESIASAILDLNDTANPMVVQNTLTVTWQPVVGAGTYNVYRAQPALYPGIDPTAAAVPIGSLFGFVGTVYGTAFSDSGVVADYSIVPPVHEDPFSPGLVISVLMNAPGAGFNQTTVTATMVSATGTGAVLQPVVIRGGLVSIIVIQSGQNYHPGDTVHITGGAGAIATPNIGPLTGTYPSVPAYFQERQVYAASPNDPDTYWMSKPGLYNNFDSRIPTLPDDSITGTPWAVQVNGIQYMVNMPGGLVVLTGLAAWQLTGVGGSSLNPQPLTPGNQQAQPQAYNGCSPNVPPIKIDLSILYVQAKGSIVRYFEYQIFQNQYYGSDITILSSHLFTRFQIVEWAWTEEPFKIIWAVRDDGTMLALTFLKQQDIQGWTRHDTNGLFLSVCSVTEPPVDALYLCVERFAGGIPSYMIERMDDRLWEDIDDCWCVDAGVALPQPTPAAVLTVNTPTGLGAVSGFADAVGGTGYSNGTTATVVDDNGEGPGVGATVGLAIVGGVITAYVVLTAGVGYISPTLVIFDPLGTGSGASATLVLDNSATFTTSSPVFSLASVGSVIRSGGGIATITQYIGPTEVVADITRPITDIYPNGTMAIPAPFGTWTLTVPTQTVAGLNHLIGAEVTGVADGAIVTPRVVSPEGTITLDVPATQVVIGLGYQVQLQSLYLDGGNPTVQGQRKKIAAVTARVEASGVGMTIGSNQPDGSIQSPAQIQTLWQSMEPMNVKSVPPFGSTVYPLYTGDVRIPVQGGFDTKGQVALQQLQPLPMQVLALIPEFSPGDLPQPPGPTHAQSPPPVRSR